MEEANTTRKKRSDTSVEIRSQSVSTFHVLFNDESKMGKDNETLKENIIVIDFRAASEMVFLLMTIFFFFLLQTIQRINSFHRQHLIKEISLSI